MSTGIATRQPDELRGAEKKEAFHVAAELGVHDFRFKRPAYDSPHGRIACKLAGTDSTRAIVEVLNPGWSGSLHYHPNQDGIWFVLKGRIRFYGPNNSIRGEYGAMEGILQPQNSRYWFEVLGEEEAWLLQIAGFPKGEAAAKRITLDREKAKTVGSSRVDMTGAGSSKPVDALAYEFLADPEKALSKE
jgi:mannose-6-phosphate isomerase-like protein (cupin superfamily)